VSVPACPGQPCQSRPVPPNLRMGQRRQSGHQDRVTHPVIPSLKSLLPTWWASGRGGPPCSHSSIIYSRPAKPENLPPQPSRKIRSGPNDPENPENPWL